ncbi:hypothetical protein [Cellulomonas sp.]|uniref:hypothetical protein n=1 Tax=Cellulomonas sp. TaxID=40001 RepID=UPI0028111912|nr:hypothetical protein [Cellulomonas sp.]
MTTHPSPDVAPTSERDERKRKKAAIAKYSLAGVALLGIGAAMTSAAWTDDAWFHGAASSASEIELMGSLTGEAGSWAEADAQGDVTLTITDDLTGFVPGEVRQVTVWLKNDSTVPLDVSSAVVTNETGVFDGGDPVTVGVAPVGVLQPTDEKAVVLTVAAPQWDNEDTAYMGADGGTFSVRFTGTTDLPTP